jgi:hypothetical protein
MKIVSGAFWSIVGLACLALASVWQFMEKDMVDFMLDTELILEIIRIVYPQSEQFLQQGAPIPYPPPMGLPLTLITGLFLIVLGTQIAANSPSWRLIGGYAHALLSVIILAFLYLFFVNGFYSDLPTDWFYIVLFSVGVLCLMQVVMAVQLLQPNRNAEALAWQPLGYATQCDKCGRGLNEHGQCPYHDVRYKQAYLYHEDTGQWFAIPRPGPARLGRGGDEEVKLIPTIHKTFETISRGHAEIAFDEQSNTFYLIDRDSKHGTWVETVKLKSRTPAELQDRVTIRFGEAAFIFQIQEVNYVEDEL